jgi:hypothetical protein
MQFILCPSYDRALNCYLKSTQARDPFDVVDNVLLRMTDLEQRKIERLGSQQKVRYLRQRSEKREALVMAEQEKQEKRIQDSHCRLFRIYLILVSLVASCLSPVNHLHTGG